VQPPEVIRLSLVERGRAGQAVCRALFVRLETLRSHCGTYHTIATACRRCAHTRRSSLLSSQQANGGGCWLALSVCRASARVVWGIDHGNQQWRAAEWCAPSFFFRVWQAQMEGNTQS
jgi:hypothetical protein